MSQRRGSTLIETLIALFILSGSLVVVFQLFIVAFKYSSADEYRGRALNLAQTHMEKIRAEALSPLAFKDGLPVYSAASQSYGAFTISTTVTAPLEGDLRSPSRAFESKFVGEEVILGGTTLTAQVVVSWRDKSGASEVRLVSLIAEPRRVYSTSAISPPGDITVNRDDLQVFTVEVRDSDGRIIEGLTFKWTQIPLTSRGRIETVDRDGRRCVFRHRLPDLGGTPTGIGPAGKCRLRATVRCQGRIYVMETGKISLQ